MQNELKEMVQIFSSSMTKLLELLTYIRIMIKFKYKKDTFNKMNFLLMCLICVFNFTGFYTIDM